MFSPSIVCCWLVGGRWGCLSGYGMSCTCSCCLLCLPLLLPPSLRGSELKSCSCTIRVSVAIDTCSFECNIRHDVMAGKPSHNFPVNGPVLLRSTGNTWMQRSAPVTAHQKGYGYVHGLADAHVVAARPFFWGMGQTVTGLQFNGNRKRGHRVQRSNPSFRGNRPGQVSWLMSPICAVAPIYTYEVVQPASGHE